MTDSIKRLKELVDSSDNIVFFGGAGVSTESGIPDFRSTGGLYHQEWKYPPEVILSHTFYESNPEEFFRFYRAKLLAPDAKPNAAHKKLAEWEAEGRLKAVITQNIDGLHQASGSRNVLELHGSVHRNHCQRCGKFYGLEHILRTEGVPRCSCGGIIKPDVVLYEEGLDQGTLEAAVRALAEADMLMIGGTSLNVYPAAGLIRYYQGHKLVLLNKSPVARDLAADLVITDPAVRRFGAGVLQAALRGLPVAFLNLQVRKKKNSKVFLFFQKYFLKRLKMQFFNDTIANSTTAACRRKERAPLWSGKRTVRTPIVRSPPPFSR